MNFPKQDPSGHMASRLPKLSVEFYFRNDIMALYKWYLSCEHCLKEGKKKKTKQPKGILQCWI